MKASNDHDLCELFPESDSSLWWILGGALLMQIDGKAVDPPAPAASLASAPPLPPSLAVASPKSREEVARALVALR